MRDLAIVLGRAEALRAQGRPAAACAILRRAVVDPPRGRAGALLFAALGVAEKEAGRPGAARRWYHRALARVDAAADRAALYHDLSGAAHAVGQRVLAERYARRALALHRDGHAIARTRAALAVILLERGQLAEAGACARTAARAFTRLRDLVERAHAGATCAAILGARGQLEPARVQYRAALALGARSLGADHPDVALWRQNLGVLLGRAGRDRAAAALLARAHRDLCAALGARHPLARACAANLRALAAAPRRTSARTS
jgi:tetratricopeptide (TPR) repeat protein